MCGQLDTRILAMPGIQSRELNDEENRTSGGAMPWVAFLILHPSSLSLMGFRLPGLPPLPSIHRTTTSRDETIVKTPKNAAATALALFALALGACASRPAKEAPVADASIAPTETSPAAQSVRFDPQETLVPLEPAVREALDPDLRFSLGLDVLVREDFERFDHRRVLVVTSRLAVDSDGRHLLETLLPLRKPLVRKVVLFNDEHAAPGRSAAIDRVLGAHPAVRAFERSPAALELTPSMVEDVDVILVDLPLRPARFYPESGFLGAVLSAAALHGLPVVVADRPLPFEADLFDGPPATMEFHRSAAAYYPTLTIPGLTVGELARLYATKYGAQADVSIVELANWRRRDGQGPWLAEIRRRGATIGAGLEEWNSYVFDDPSRARWQVTADLLPPAFGAKVVGPPYALEMASSSRPPADAVAALAPLLPAEVAAAPLPAAADGAAATGIRLAASAPFPPASTAFVLRTLDPAADWGEAVDPFCNPAVADSLRQGRDTRETRRLWGLAPEAQEFATRRKDFVLYH